MNAVTRRQTSLINSEREIWIVQRYLAHYRQPVLDKLDDYLQQRGYVLKVVFDPDRLEGPADPNRPYCDPFVELRDHSHLGFPAWSLRGLLAGIRERHPAAVIVEGTPRILTNIRVPAVTRAAGGVSLLWSKGHTEESTRKGRTVDFARFHFAQLFDGIICYGEEGRRDLERIGVPGNKITVARNTIDTGRIFADLPDRDANALDLKRKHRLDGRKIVLCCSTMYPKKRHLDLIEAWPSIRATHPDASLVMVGGGPMLESVRARAADIGGDDIQVLGRVPEGEDYHWIGACDVSVMCGGLGLAIQQSLAFGRPMIVADESGVDGEIVRHGETGWRYPKGDVKALVNTVNSVLADPAGSAVTAQRGQDLVRNEVNIDNMVESFVTALKRAGILQGT